MMKKASFFVLFILVSGVALDACQSNDAVTLPAKKKVQALLTKYLYKNNVAGVNVSIKLPDQPVANYSAGLGNLQRKTAMPRQALMPIGDITKSFTSAIILKLQQQGKLNIQDRLWRLARPNTQLAKILKQYPHLAKLKLIHLLTHTSGLHTALDTSQYAEVLSEKPLQMYPDKDVVQISMAFKPYFKPGEKYKFHYSDVDYVLAGLVIESVTGHSVYDEMQSLFEDAKLTSIYYPQTEVNIPARQSHRMVQGYMPEGSRWFKVFGPLFERYPVVTIPGVRTVKAYDVTNVDYKQLATGAAADGIVADSGTLAKWFWSLFNNRVLDERSVKLMQKTVPTDFGYGYGLGIRSRHLEEIHFNSISHNGAEFGYNAIVVYLKEPNMAIAIIINTQKDTLNMEKGLLHKLLKILLNR